MSRTPDGKYANRNSSNPNISADGNWVTFLTDADTLDVRDSNTAVGFVSVQSTNERSELVSVSADGTKAAGGDPRVSSNPMSADGRFIAYRSSSNIVADVSLDGTSNAVLFDRISQKTTLVSADADGKRTNGFNVTITPNGQFVAFVSNDPDVAADVKNTTAASVCIAPMSVI